MLVFFVCQVNTNLTLLENESKLKERVSELSDMCNDRLRKLKELKDAEKELCYILTEKPCDVPGGIVPSAEQLEHLQEHILGLEHEKVRAGVVVDHVTYLLACIYVVMLRCSG